MNQQIKMLTSSIIVASFTVGGPSDGGLICFDFFFFLRQSTNLS